ncbi:glucose 1-dehydrogenase [Luteolibacter sp. GHJ8]|uniref:Glucose 1-dehydrogenase n=1 Tax=Luteolibacter rhizosphaerae TaxID=2989719 RepID=A0ABT3G8N4_9BACT|nr:glucose 1-dehydrogenase [Luteolibacter rhizosphaerae]MCW1915856.1 glucose 1-dehydrogenase [Luteolibacter rhizosphaerae]
MSNKSKGEHEHPQRPEQEQAKQPGREGEMNPSPVFENPELRGSGRLAGRVAIITGGDSGIGRATAVAFAREGADIAIIYLEEDEDARATAALIHEKGQRCLLHKADIGQREACREAIAVTLQTFGKLDILVNNAAEQHPQESIADITEDQLERTFRTNIFAMFHLTAAALPELMKSRAAAIINTTSVTAYRGSPKLLDYSATKGAIVSFTRSLAGQLAKEKIRVNAVAPGPIWTPLIPATFPADEVATFGSDSPLGRAGEPWECAECFVFLASDAASYITGQVLHPNGGEIING